MIFITLYLSTWQIKSFKKYWPRNCLRFPGLPFHLCEGVHPDRVRKTGRCENRIMRRIDQLVSRSVTIQNVTGRVPFGPKEPKIMSENFTKISASQLPAWKTITFWNFVGATAKNTLAESDPAKKVLIARKKWNKKGVSFWQWGKQSAKCVVMVLVWFGWLVLRGWVSGWPPWLQTSALVSIHRKENCPGPSWLPAPQHRLFRAF